MSTIKALLAQYWGPSNYMESLAKYTYRLIVVSAITLLLLTTFTLLAG